jgi:phosphoglycolate phosphatase-like HAD superfamily hydrolase
VDSPPLGLPLDEACAIAGISVADYMTSYDSTLVRPFPGVVEMLTSLERWAVCSNKHPDAGAAELDLLGWSPEVAQFAAPGGGPKALAPVLEAMGLSAEQVVFVGDTDHDRACAVAVGCRFLFAGWNPRAEPQASDVVLRAPSEVLAHLSR